MSKGNDPLSGQLSVDADPLCPIFGQCGGCSYQHLSYEMELEIKEELLKNFFLKELNIDNDLFGKMIASPKDYHYRHRIDLKLDRRKNGEVTIGFSPLGNGPTLSIDHCYIAREELSRELPRIKKEAIDRLTDKYRQANLVIRTDDSGRVFWGGVGKRSLELSKEDYLWTEINGRRIFYSMNTFFQANLSILPKVIDMIRSLNVWQLESVLFDLYGGVGLFSVCLFDKVKRVVLMDESLPSMDVAQTSLEYNNISNVRIVGGRVEEQLPKILEEMKEKKLIAIIDPPRSGLSDTALTMMVNLKSFKNILYVSCDPESLIRDLKQFIANGWAVEKVVPMDFFPRTRHLETFVVLNKM